MQKEFKRAVFQLKGSNFAVSIWWQQENAQMGSRPYIHDISGLCATSGWMPAASPGVNLSTPMSNKTTTNPYRGIQIPANPSLDCMRFEGTPSNARSRSALRALTTFILPSPKNALRTPSDSGEEGKVTSTFSDRLGLMRRIEDSATKRAIEVSARETRNGHASAHPETDCHSMCAS